MRRLANAQISSPPKGKAARPALTPSSESRYAPQAGQPTPKAPTIPATTEPVGAEVASRARVSRVKIATLAPKSPEVTGTNSERTGRYTGLAELADTRRARAV